MAQATKTLGNWGEQRAAEFLEKLGYKIITRNFRHGHGGLI
jgi:Holliday junction resolvase-like predicted endonuclease